MTLISVVYCCLVLLYFYAKSSIDFTGTITTPDGFPTVMAAFISSYFQYAQMAMVFVVTTILHAKFTNPRSATGYLSLPGTSLEKYIVMLADYALAYIAVFVLWVVLHYLTMAVCWFVSPEVSWNVNPLQFITPATSMDDIMLKIEGVTFTDAMNTALAESGMPEFFFNGLKDIVYTMYWFAPIVTLVQFFAYICVNMLFRTNGQLKTIAIYFAAGFVLTILFTITFCVAMAHDISAIGDVSETAVASAIIGDLMAMLNIWKWLCYFTPAILVGLAYLFYNQICKKQAK